MSREKQSPLMLCQMRGLPCNFAVGTDEAKIQHLKVPGLETLPAHSARCFAGAGYAVSESREVLSAPLSA